LSGIFVSYRRSDSEGEAGRLFDDLVKHFGEQTVFMDVAAIEAGRDFRKAIEEGVSKCGALLVLIGPEWLSAKDERGSRRLDNPMDFVRIETAHALKRDIAVIPVLVRAARMPSAEQLPEDLKELAYRNCIELTHARWKSDIQLLIQALRRVLGHSAEIKAVSGTTRTAGGPAQLDTGLADGSATQIDPATLQRVTRELSACIGPIAGIVVKRAAARCDSVEDLYLAVAQEIDRPEEREKFLRQRRSIPSNPHPAAADSRTSTPVASHKPSISNGVVEPSPAVETRSPSKWKDLAKGTIRRYFKTRDS
jgi:hypothetical protein